MKNAIPKQPDPQHLGPVAARSARRALAHREASHDDAVRRLVAASFALIHETGSLEPSVASIVSRAGLSNQAFYRHFHSKDELLLGVLDEGFRLLAGYLAHRVESASGSEAKIRTWIGGVLEAADRPEPTDFGLVAQGNLEQVPWRGVNIHVPPLALQRAAAVRRGLGDRVAAIDAWGRL